MERRFPWQWAEGRAELLVALVCMFCAAFAAPVFVERILDYSTFNATEQGLPLVLSTAAWAWAFRRVLWKRRLVHALWVGPLFGALNAGTTVGLSALVAGEGGGDVVSGFFVGTFFGSVFGGGPLGLVFGAALALFLKFTRAFIAHTDKSPSLPVLRASSYFVAFAGTCCSVFQRGSDDMWSTNVLLLGGAGFCAAASFTHLRALLWTRNIRAGAEPGARIREERETALVVIDERGSEVGAFRTPERQHVLGPLPNRLALGAAQCVASLLITLLAWMMLAQA